MRISGLSLCFDEHNKIQVIYGVSDGSTYSHAFFSRAGAQNWVTYNPFNDNKPIWWLSDYPHMIKKLRNFIINPDGNLQFKDKKIHLSHFIPVVEGRCMKLNWKHIKLTPRSKMSVKRAVCVCSLEVALDMFKRLSSPEETVSTRKYLINCYKLFKLFNNNTGVDPSCYRQLLAIMFFFDKWYSETKDAIKDRDKKNIDLKIHWKRFIPRITYKDLKRTIRAFLGVVQYVQLHYPHIQLIPKTMCQDDVENYFSLQRARVPGGKPTALQFFQSSASLTKQMLLNAEIKELKGTCGSYYAASLPNVANIPLVKQSDQPKQSFCEKNGWELCKFMLNNNDEIIDRWSYNESFHDHADKLHLSRHVKQTIEYVDLFSPTTILRTSQPILTSLRASSNHTHLLSFACHLDFYLRTTFFYGNWRSTALQDAIESLKNEKALCYYWKTLLCNINIPNELIEISCDVLSSFVGKFSKRICVLFLAKDGLSPVNEDDESAVRQMLKTFDGKKKKKSGCDDDEDKGNDVCFRCQKQAVGHLNALKAMNQDGLKNKHVSNVVKLVISNLNVQIYKRTK